MLLCACAHQPTSRPGTAPVAAPPASPAPTPVEPAPAPAASQARIRVAKSQQFEQDKTRLKRSLARTSRDALAPREVGYYLDILQGRIRQVMGPGIVLGRGYDRIVLDLSNLVSFDNAGSGLDKEDRQSLSLLVPVLREYAKTLISIKVRASDRGSAAAALARTQAGAVARFLSDSGLPAKRILVSEMTPQDANVRVEMQLEPIVRIRPR